MTVSKEYFLKVSYAVEKLVGFNDTLFDDSTFLKKAGELYPKLINQDNKRFLLYFDVIKCYVCLGHDMDLSAKESLAFFLTLFPDDPEYDYLDMAISIGKDAYDSLKDSIKSQVETSLIDQPFLIVSVLESLGLAEQIKSFYIYIYRYASLVAKADDVIDKKESAWLANLLKSGQNTGARFPLYEVRNAVNGNICPEKTADQPVKQIESQALDELDALIGLNNVKEDIHTLANFAMVQKKRAQLGIKATPLSLHSVFVGNPGTGKTTVARIMGRLFRELGLLRSGQLIEVDRSALVANYVGQTAGKTNNVINSALDGVLFIDEAYSLVNEAKEDYGNEAISTLLKRMEDERDRLVVILAGYTDKMEEFLSSNPGLRSRFARKICFNDYSADELYEIYAIQLAKYEYSITDEAKQIVLSKINSAVNAHYDDFGNGRYARNLFERTIELQANRVAFIPATTVEILNTIEACDVEQL